MKYNFIIAKMAQIKMTKRSRLARESACRRKGFDVVIGVDEAGRGPLAGPVVAGAVALVDLSIRDRAFKYLLDEVGDSKKISARKREIIYKLLASHEYVTWASAAVAPKTIDRINILEASKLAMARAVAGLVAKLGGAGKTRRILCLIDGNFPIETPYQQASIIGGDAKVFSISAASIIAKVTRDRLMTRLEKKYPGYQFRHNKGYPTKQHLEALKSLGLSPAHRKSYGPCKRRSFQNL
jgi:ribonuclease HII